MGENININMYLSLENTTGLEEHRFIPEASDPKNVGIDDEAAKFDVYYFIDCKTK